MSIDKREAFGVVQVEAMHFNCALLTTHPQGSGMKEINDDNVTGMVIKNNNPKKIANMIVKIFKNDIELMKFKKNSRLKQIKYYDLDSLNKKTLELFNK